MFLLIDKPKGITSHDAIDIVRKITGEKRVGHAGTLDPNATGLLIVGIGRESTKKLGDISRKTTKEYEAEIILGEERDTDDAEGRKPTMSNKQFSNNDQIPKSKIINALKTFLGKQLQTPPAYSAIKIGGKKAYQLARKGNEVKLQPRKVRIYSIKLIEYEYPLLKIDTKVSSGTYIRALARDIGRELGTGAYLNNLRRTRIGNYSVEKGISLEKLNTDNWKTYIIEI